MSKMFPFISETWNPLGGECKHGCTYCWAKQLIKRYSMQKYLGEPTLKNKDIYRTFKAGDFVFTCDMTDLFGAWVPSEMIQAVLDIIDTSPAQFLLLTKNPARYSEFSLPKNCVAGVTIECDMISKASGCAPSVYDRINYLKSCRRTEYRKMVSIEPIMMFTESFAYTLAESNPEFVAVGYDNYSNNLVEPSLAKTERLIATLEELGIKVYRKTLREAIPHKKEILT
jgi:protein gp37